MWLIGLVLGATLVDLLLLSRATALLSRLSFMPLSGMRRIEIDPALAETALIEPDEVRSYREAPERRIDERRLPWPRNQETRLGATKFLQDESAIALRTKWSGKRLPAVGRVDVRGTRDAIELRARFTPSPLSVLTLIGLLVLSFAARFDVELLTYCMAIGMAHVLMSVVGLRRQLNRAEAAFRIALDEAKPEERRIEVPLRIDATPLAAHGGEEPEHHAERENEA